MIGQILASAYWLEPGIFCYGRKERHLPGVGWYQRKKLKLFPSPSGKKLEIFIHTSHSVEFNTRSFLFEDCTWLGTHVWQVQKCLVSQEPSNKLSTAKHVLSGGSWDQTLTRSEGPVPNERLLIIDSPGQKVKCYVNLYFAMIPATRYECLVVGREVWAERYLSDIPPY